MRWPLRRFRVVLVLGGAAAISLFLGPAGQAQRANPEGHGNTELALLAKAQKAVAADRNPARELSDVTGSITPGGSPLTVTISNANDNAYITFSGTANQRVSLNMTSVSISFSYVSILKPDNSTLVSSTAVFTSGKFINTVTLPATGMYKVLVDPQDAATGSTTLTMYSVPADAAGKLAIGGYARTATVTIPGHNPTYTFRGSALEPVKVTITGSTILYSQISIKKPDGSNVLTSSVFTGSATVGPTVLPAVDGTYSLVVDPVQENTGSMTVKLVRSSAWQRLPLTRVACKSRGRHARALF